MFKIIVFSILATIAMYIFLYIKSEREEEKYHKDLLDKINKYKETILVILFAISCSSTIEQSKVKPMDTAKYLETQEKTLFMNSWHMMVPDIKLQLELVGIPNVNLVLKEFVFVDNYNVSMAFASIFSNGVKKLDIFIILAKNNNIWIPITNVMRD